MMTFRFGGIGRRARLGGFCSQVRRGRLVAAAQLLLGTLPADAQQAGVYNGHTADGTSIQITVATDAATGQLQVQKLCAAEFVAPSCRMSTYWDFNVCAGPGSDIANGQATLLTNTQTVFASATVKFIGGQKVHGQVTILAPIMTSPNGTPAADMCGVSHQAYLGSGP